VSHYDSEPESEKDSDYGDEFYYSDDSIDLREITFEMPDRFTNSLEYLYTIMEMMDLEHRDIKRKKYKIE
jgi:hypothetical protein